MRIQLSDNGVVQNIVDVNDDGEIIARDHMSAARVDEILKGNHNMREHLTQNKKAGGQLIASIPLTVYENWKKTWSTKWRDVFAWDTYLAAKLQDPDNALLLTSTKKNLMPTKAARFRTFS